jgi:hypothetical protein
VDDEAREKCVLRSRRTDAELVVLGGGMGFPCAVGEAKRDVGVVRDEKIGNENGMERREGLEAEEDAGGPGSVGPGVTALDMLGIRVEDAVWEGRDSGMDEDEGSETGARCAADDMVRQGQESEGGALLRSNRSPERRVIYMCMQRRTEKGKGSGSQ